MIVPFVPVRHPVEAHGRQVSLLQVVLKEPLVRRRAEVVRRVVSTVVADLGEYP